MDIIDAINMESNWTINRRTKAVKDDEIMGFFCVILDFEID